MLDIFLFGSATPATDIILRDPTRAAIDVNATPGVSFGTSATLAATATLSASAVFGIATDTTLKLGGPLLATTGVSIGADGTYLPLLNPLDASPAFAVAAHGDIIVPGELRAAAAVTVTSVAPRLTTGALAVAAASSVNLGATAFLSSLAASFTATSALRFGVAVSLEVKGASATDAVIAFDGKITPLVRVGSIAIDDILNEAPNTCAFICDSNPPAAGTDVKIGLQNLLVQNLLFAGTVIRREQKYDVGRNQLYWTVECSDYTYLLNRRRVFGTWTNVSASTVARAVLTSYTSGFSAAGIADNLDPVTVTWNGITVMDALTQLAGLVGGYTKVDYGKVVSLFVTDPGPSPTPVVPGNKLLMLFPPVTPRVDLSQTRTRVDIRGAATTIVGPGKASPVAFDNALAGGSVNGVTSKTTRYTVTPGTSLLLVFVSNSNGTITSATYSGVAMTLLATFNGSAGVSYLFALANPPAGALDIGVVASAPTYIGVTADSYVGVAMPTAANCLTLGATGTTALLFNMTQPAGGGSWMVAFGKNMIPSGPMLATVSGGVVRASANTDAVATAADSGGAFVGPLVMNAPTPTNWNGIAVALAPLVLDTGITSPTVPVADATKFSSGTVITDDGQILPYTGTNPGGVPATIVGNVPGPATSGTPALAPGVAGRLSGVYRWAIAFASRDGETTIGPPSASLFCPDVTSPTSAPGLGYANLVGPLAGTYDYRVAYLTSLGETLPGPSSRRTAAALAPPAFNLSSTAGLCRLAPGQYRYLLTYRTAYGETLASPAATVTQVDVPAPFGLSVSNLNPPGPLKAASYTYRSTLVTIDGESAPGTAVAFTPSALALPPVGSFAASGFGGLRGGPYYYGISFVTLLGESLLNVQYAGTGFGQIWPAAGPSWSGSLDGNGRMSPGSTYFYASTFYSDQWGETLLSANSQTITIGGANPFRLLINIGVFPPSGADGMRVYRAISGGQLALVADFRQGNVPSQFWDGLHQSETGGPPLTGLRAGSGCSVMMYPAGESGVIARRLYRTKANGGEYFLVVEIQSNNQVQVLDQFEDAQLLQRSLAYATTGRLASVNLPTGPAGTLARRVYRSRRDTAAPLYFVGEVRDNTTTTFTDNVDDTALASTMPGTNTAGSSTLPVVFLPTGPPGVLARRIYRTRANGTLYALLAEIPDNTTGSYTDNTPDDALTGDAPPTASIVGEQVIVTSLPVGPTGTLARVIYRTKAGGGEFHEVERISDNATTSYVDTVPDANLGGGPSLVNNAGSSAVNVSNIPLGPVGVASRVIYRTLAGGSEFHYVGALDDNTATTFLDTVGDTELGRKNLDTSTVGAFVGDAFLRLDTVAAFPAAGWIHVDNQFIRYGSIVGTTLSAIPRTGAGAILAPIRGGTAVLTVPQLTGVSNITTPLAVGSSLALWVVVNSAAGQAALAAIIGGDGVQEFVVADATLDAAGCTKRGLAELELFQYAQVEFDYTSRDRLTRSGATVTANLPAPWNVVGSFVIQSVKITEVDVAPKVFPKYAVSCSNTKYTLEDLLRHVVLA